MDGTRSNSGELKRKRFSTDLVTIGMLEDICDLETF